MHNDTSVQSNDLDSNPVVGNVKEDNVLQHNAAIWARSFSVFSISHHREAIRTMRSEIFQQTVSIIKVGHYISEKNKKVSLPSDSEMISNTRFYSDRVDVSNVPNQENETAIQVDNIDCLLAAQKLTKLGYNPAVLNMASRQNPGGGVYHGAGAQEENLFRRSNLYRSMFQFAPYAELYGLHPSSDQYPLDRNFGGVYTPNAIVFRGTEREGYPLLDEPYKMSFVAVPGMNRPQLGHGLIVPELIEPIKNKMRTIFRIGLKHGHDSLVLGALGCGAFRNPPRHIAKLFHEVIEEVEFKNRYRLLYFAILEDHNSGKDHNPDGNYQPFCDEFNEDKRGINEK